MFENLSNKLENAFNRLRGQGKVREGNIQEALHEVRVALLEADVNYRVVKEFIAHVKEKAIGAEVLRSLSPGQQFIKIVNEELIRLMGSESKDVDLSRTPPVPMMLVGLQGSGKTTTAAKLALYLKERYHRVPFLVPADVYRPAAILQLKTLGSQLGVQVFDSEGIPDPVAIARQAMERAPALGCDVVILDTAGRLHVDDQLMEELEKIKLAIRPQEILFVADAMTGQDAVTVAKEFDSRLEIQGVVLTKLDGDARGGAALSIKTVTGKPIKFVGIGEKLDALELFHPDRMASRILGMGDILSFIEKAEEVYSEEQAAELERKIRKNAFTIEDFRDQLKQLKSMGPLENLLGMIPGIGKALKGGDLGPAEAELRKIEAIINSMTAAERKNHQLLDGSRRRRIASGSGSSVQDVNRFLKQYLEMRKMMQKMMKPGRFGGMFGMDPRLLGS